MPTEYKYELWNGKEVVGYFYSTFTLFGRYVHIPETSVFKQSYYTETKSITVPLIERVVSQTATDRLTRVVLDVRRKSKRQIEIISRG